MVEEVVDPLTKYPPAYKEVRDKIFEVAVKEKCGMYFTRDVEYPWALEQAQLRTDGKPEVILDAGCDKAPLALYLGQVLRHEVYGIDIEDYASFYEDTMVRFKRGSAAKTGYKDAFFDKIFCISVLEHLPPEEGKAVLAEFQRILKPTGMVIITMDKKNGCRDDPFLGEYQEAIRGMFTVVAEADLYNDLIWGVVVRQRV